MLCCHLLILNINVHILTKVYMRMCLDCNTTFCAVAKSEDLLWVLSLYWHPRRKKNDEDRLLTLGF